MAHENRLLVEGNNDEHVLYSLLKLHSVPDAFEIKNTKGIPSILETLEVYLLESGIKRLGVIVDADTDIDARWQSLRDVLLRQCGYSDVPEHPDPAGTIIRQHDRPTLGIWLMPDNVLPGMLEHFVAFLVPPEDGLWPRAEECIASIPEHEQRFAPQHRIKAQIHTWLAWQSVPGKPLGQAITARYLDADSAHANLLMTWVRTLFDL